MFPKPWTVTPTGPNECVVCDADGQKLFYIVGDEGDVESDVEIEPSVLFHGEETDELLKEIERCLTSKS